MVKFKKFKVVAFMFVAIFAFSSIASARHQGQLVYVDNVVRETNGEILNGEIVSTGDLKVRDISTDIERTVVKNNSGLIILNPAFTSDGKNILFTAGNTNNKYKIYLVSSQVLTKLDTNTTYLKKDDTYNLRYASLSLNSDGATTGRLTYTKDTDQKTGTHELWVYDFPTGKSSMVARESNKQLKHPVFLADNQTVAYIGVTGGIQDIYTINVTAFTYANNLTNNISPTPRYGRLVSNLNKTTTTTADLLIYSKQLYGSGEYQKFDIFVRNLSSNNDVNVTNTSNLDEFEPSFYGDSTTNPSLSTTGDMLYSAKIANNTSIWQTNFSTTQSASSNGIKFERTTENTGLANWGKSIDIISDEFLIALDETRFVFNNTSGDENEISRADVNLNGTTTTPLQITSSVSGAPIIKSNPSLSGNGGAILFEEPQTVIIKKMNYDGSGSKVIAKAEDTSPASYNLKQPNISSDGRWAVYVRDGGLYVKNLSDLTSSETDLGLNLTDAFNPSFNPEMTQIVYTRDNGMTGSSIYMVRVKIDIDTNTISAVGTEQQLTDEGGNVNDVYPSFSPDGKYIIFTSNRWDGKVAIYVMRADKEGLSGSGVIRIVENSRLNDGNQLAVFGPVNTDPNNYYVAYVNRTGVIQIGTLNKDLSSVLYGEELVVNLTSNTGIRPKGKFSWARRRVAGSIFAERIVQTKAVKESEISYYIKVDVDEVSVPSAYILEEILPGWTLPNGVTTDILIDGESANASGTYFISGNPTKDENTLRIVFSGAISSPNDKPRDHIIKITAKVSDGDNGDLQTIFGTVTHNGLIENITGNNTLILGSPYCPFDIYNSNGEQRTDDDIGIIESLDLIYAIECWARDVQLQGHKGLWPFDLSKYDSIILKTIEIWATKLADCELGEYEFDSNGTDEMYWKSGEWIE
ncbi:hypothetical protein M0P98_08670 [bacterium]|nr:hypothetical protein [bacterium]